MKKVGVILSGCGVYDGSEVHEAVLTLLALDRNRAEAVCIAPDMEFEEVNHVTGEGTGAKRNVLQESARIVRGNIKEIKVVAASDLDAVIIPGGMGAAKNLCDFAVKGPDASIHPDVARLIKEMTLAKKPIGAICIAPALVAAVLGKEYAPSVTIGTDSGTATAIFQTGSIHVECSATDFVVDKKHKIVSTPAYMLAKNISEAAVGIEKAVKAVLELM